MKYFVEVLWDVGSDTPVACRSLSSAGTKALNLLHRNRAMDGFVCVRITDEEGQERGRVIYAPEK